MASVTGYSTSNPHISYDIYVDQNSQSVSGNYSNVTVSVRFYRTNTGYTTWGSGTVYCKIDGTTYTAGIDPSQKITENGITLFSRTLNIGHNSDGTKRLSVSAWISHNAPLSSSEQGFSTDLTTIPRASSLSVGNGTLGTSLDMTISRASGSFGHIITYKCGSASGTAVSKTGLTKVSWTPPLSLASQNTTGTSVTIKLTLTTYLGSTVIGSKTKTISCSIPSSVAPNCNLTITDPTDVYSTFNCYVQNMSKLKIDVTDVPSYDSPIISYTIRANDGVYSSSSVITDFIKRSGTLNINCTVKDKRGRSGSSNSTVTVLPYEKPVINNISFVRDYTESTPVLRVCYDCSITDLNGKNTFVIKKLEYKKTSEDTYSIPPIEQVYDNSDVSKSVMVKFLWDPSSSYDIKITVSDNLSTAMSTAKTSTEFAFMHFKGTNSMGLGKMSELDNGLDIGFPTRLDGGLVYPIIPSGTDLNTVIKPNFYTGSNGTLSGNYTNMPVTERDSTFYLETLRSGGSDQITQQLITCEKPSNETYRRSYHSGTWGKWHNISHGDILYDNNTNSGSMGSIVLRNIYNESSFPYKYLEIYYTNGYATSQYVKVRTDISPIYVTLIFIDAYSTTSTMILRSHYFIDTTAWTLSPYDISSTGAYVMMDKSSIRHYAAGSNAFSIRRVIGII